MQANRRNDNREHQLSVSPLLTPLDRETRTVLPTAEAAAHLNRKPQTLRHWVSDGSGPFQPVRTNGRLGWPVASIKKALGLAVIS